MSPPLDAEKPNTPFHSIGNLERCCRQVPLVNWLSPPCECEPAGNYFVLTQLERPTIEWAQQPILRISNYSPTLGLAQGTRPRENSPRNKPQHRILSILTSLRVGEKKQRETGASDPNMRDVVDNIQDKAHDTGGDPCKGPARPARHGERSIRTKSTVMPIAPPGTQIASSTIILSNSCSSVRCGRSLSMETLNSTKLSTSSYLPIAGRSRATKTHILASLSS